MELSLRHVDFVDGMIEIKEEKKIKENLKKNNL